MGVLRRGHDSRCLLLSSDVSGSKSRNTSTSAGSGASGRIRRVSENAKRSAGTVPEWDKSYTEFVNVNGAGPGISTGVNTSAAVSFISMGASSLINVLKGANGASQTAGLNEHAVLLLN